MNYCLFKLRFTTPVHFGTPDSALSLYSSEDHFLADTFFSALCHEAAALWGETGLRDLLAQAEQGRLLLSDAMPWRDDAFFLPRPFVNGKPFSEEVPAGERKAVKKLRWISVDAFDHFFCAVNTGKRFHPEEGTDHFGIEDEMTRVALAGLDMARPYQVGIFRFQENCGLYFVAGCAGEREESILIKLTEAVGQTGIGGKHSSGLGKFLIEDSILLNEPFDTQTQWLFQALSAEDCGRYVLLTSSLPEEKDLERVIRNASYQLVRRGGFVGSASFAETPMKKKTEYFLRAGSVLTQRFQGSLRQAADGGTHQVLRFNQPLFLGVNV